MMNRFMLSSWHIFHVSVLLELMQLSPIVDAGMRLGEGTGASLAIVVLQAAMDVYNHLSR